MKAQEVLLDGSKKRYMLQNERGIPVIPVMKYLKYLDVTGKSSNTQRFIKKSNGILFPACSTIKPYYRTTP